MDATIKPPIMVVEGQVARSHQLIWLTLIYIAISHFTYSLFSLFKVNNLVNTNVKKTPTPPSFMQKGRWGLFWSIFFMQPPCFGHFFFVRIF